MFNRAALLVLAVLFAGCSSSSSEPSGTATQSTESVSTASDEPVAATEPTVAEPTVTQPTVAEPTVAQPTVAQPTVAQPTVAQPTVAQTETEAQAESTVVPLRPYGDVAPAPTSAVDDSVYITRESMSATSIGVKWSTHDDAVEYHLHRLLRTDDRRPSPDAMTDDTLLQIVFDAGRFVDEGVVAGSRYWYGLRALDAGGVPVAHGWHRTAAVTDTEPPSPVGSLTAGFDNGEMLVTWTRPDENYELHGYQILRGIDGEEPTSVIRTWNLEQTSFIDDDAPTSGVVSYAVVAFDFHWNDSVAVQVDVDLG